MINSSDSLVFSLNLKQHLEVVRTNWNAYEVHKSAGLKILHYKYHFKYFTQFEVLIQSLNSITFDA